MGMKLTVDVEIYRPVVHDLRERLAIGDELSDELLMELLVNDVLGRNIGVPGYLDSPSVLEALDEALEEFCYEVGLA